MRELSGNNEFRNIVDTVPFTGGDGGKHSDLGVLKVVLGSVIRRLDRRSKDLHYENTVTSNNIEDL